MHLLGEAQVRFPINFSSILITHSSCFPAILGIFTSELDLNYIFGKELFWFLEPVTGEWEPELLMFMIM